MCFSAGFKDQLTVLEARWQQGACAVIKHLSLIYLGEIHLRKRNLNPKEARLYLPWFLGLPGLCLSTQVANSRVTIWDGTQFYFLNLIIYNYI